MHKQNYYSNTTHIKFVFKYISKMSFMDIKLLIEDKITFVINQIGTNHLIL